MSVLVAVATYRRPDLLRELLPHLLEQTSTAPFEATVLVVDNDPDGGAAPVGQTAATTYLHEPRPGIAAARNRALAHAEATGAAAVVFIDDDEIPRPGWLPALHEHWRSTGCAAVAGPVVSHWSGPADPWVSAGRTFERPRRATGTTMTSAATSNLLLDTGFLRRNDIRFDDAFGLTGGSDTLLTREITARGGSVRWCDEAEVAEQVPPGRLSRGFVLRRHLRTGTTYSRVHLTLRRRGFAGQHGRGELLLRAGRRSGRGLLALLARDGRTRRRGVCDLATAAGILAGAVGVHYAEYSRTRAGRFPSAAADNTSSTPST